MNLNTIRRSIASSFAIRQNRTIQSGRSWWIWQWWKDKIARMVRRFVSILLGDVLGERLGREGRAGSGASLRNKRPRYRSSACLHHTYDIPSGFNSGRLQYRPDDAVLEEIEGEFRFVELTALPSVTRRNRLLLLFSVRDSEKLLAHHFCRRHYLYYN